MLVLLKELCAFSKKQSINTKLTCQKSLKTKIDLKVIYANRQALFSTRQKYLNLNKNTHSLTFNLSHNFSTQLNKKVRPANFNQVYKKGEQQLNQIQKLNGKDNPQYINKLFAQALVCLNYVNRSANNQANIKAKQIFTSVKNLLTSDKKLMRVDGQLHPQLNLEIYFIDFYLGRNYYIQGNHQQAIKQLKSFLNKPNKLLDMKQNIVPRRQYHFFSYVFLMKSYFVIGNHQQAREYFKKFKDLTEFREQQLNVEKVNQLIPILTYIIQEHKLDPKLSDEAIQILKSKANLKNAKQLYIVYQAVDYYSSSKNYLQTMNFLLKQQLTIFPQKPQNEIPHLRTLQEYNLLSLKQIKKKSNNPSQVSWKGFTSIEDLMDHKCVKIQTQLWNTKKQLTDGKIKQAQKSIQLAIQYCEQAEEITSTLSLEYLRIIKKIQSMEQSKSLDQNEQKIRTLIGKLQERIVDKFYSTRQKC